MKRIPLILIGLLLLRSSTYLPVLGSSVAHAQLLASAETSTLVASITMEGNPKAPLWAMFPTPKVQRISVKQQNTPPVPHQHSHSEEPTPPVVRIPQAVATSSIPAVINQPDIKPHHRKLAATVLNVLPSNCQGTLKKFYVRYDNPKSRGLAGKTTMILSGKVPDEEFMALFIHEYGHITDLGCLAGNPLSGTSAFRDGNEAIYNDDPSVGFYQISWKDSKTHRNETTDADFVSGYASWDPFEDFAETYAYYLLQRDAFRERAETNASLAAKYRWMEQHVFAEPINIAIGKHQWTGKVPWDITKLPYIWRAATIAAQ